MNLAAFALSPALWLTIDALAVYRLTILLTRDTITEPFRGRIRAAGYTGTGAPRPGRGALRWLFDLVTCPWCSGVWIAGVVVLLTVYVPSGWKYVAYLLACAAAAGFLSEKS